MSEECKYEEIKDYKKAFQCFNKRFLEEKKSIFDLTDLDTNCNENNSKVCCVLKEENVEYLIDNFINNGYGGDASFIDKIKYQLITNPANTFDKKDDELILLQKSALEVLATAVWLWRLVPSNAKISSTKSSVEEILNLYLNKDNKEKVSVDKDKNFFNKGIEGIASVGTYYNTNKPFELAYIIKFFSEYLKNKTQQKSSIDILKEIIYDKSDKQKNLVGYMKITTASDNRKARLLNKKNSSEHSLSNDEKENLEPIKSVSIYNALLFFFNPENYEAIVSNDHKKNIIESFEYLLEDIEDDNDIKIAYIKKKLLENDKYKDLKEEAHFFYVDKIRELWDPTILPSKNVIYYGAPGTGKTYSLKKLVEQKTDNNKCYYKVVQFHPSYSYEDFIDGVKPVGNGKNGLNLQLVNGIFKKMCIDAFTELEKNKDNPEEAKKFYFIADEINRAELSRVFGELLLCLEEDKRLRYEKNKNGNIELKGELIKTQNSDLWTEIHAVVKLENKEECSEHDNGLYFGVPENIYFLGTMNDIDRSIDSFDLALRRRFKWVRKNCDYDVVSDYLMEEGADDFIDEYIGDGKEKGKSKGRCLLLNEYISDTLNLGKSYELGHTYFMKIKIWNKKITQTAYDNLFNQEIGPLVAEYLRAEVADGKELESKLKEMRNLFTTGKK